jgi:hypothetical protein
MSRGGIRVVALTLPRQSLARSDHDRHKRRGATRFSGEAGGLVGGGQETRDDVVSLGAIGGRSCFRPRKPVAVLLGTIVSFGCACASRQSADATTPAVERRPVSEAAITGEPQATGEAGATSEAAEGQGDQELTPASGRVEQSGAETDCPMQIRDARLSALPAMGGVTFLFTTKSQGSLDELRRRALALHDAYARGLSPTLAAASDPAAKTTIETSVDYVDERDGARIEVRAIHQNDVDELRERLREDTTAMTDQRRCPALAGAGAGVGSQEGASR